jgi:hypothetical protein
VLNLSAQRAAVARDAGIARSPSRFLRAGIVATSASNFCETDRPGLLRNPKEPERPEAMQQNAIAIFSNGSTGMKSGSIISSLMVRV